MTNASGVAADRLKSFIERVERLTEEKQAIADDIKEVFAEAKSAGFETKIMKMIIKLRAMDAQERSEQEQLLDVYAQAVGLAHTPLGDAAETREKADRAPSVAKAVAAFVEGIPEGGSVTVMSGGKSTTIKKDAAGKATVEQTPVQAKPDPDADYTAARDAPLSPEPLAPPRDVAGSVNALRRAMNAPSR